jgi:hypothetical protein
MSEPFAEIIGRDGRRRRAKKGDVLADGERVVVSMSFMDAALHDELVAKHRGDAVVRVVDAAGQPAGHRPGFLMLDRDPALVDAAAEAYAERSRRLETAWQPRDPDQHGGHCADHRRGHQDLTRDRASRPLTLDEARAAADAAREARDERLRNAWRSHHV